jgi:hypothetical protein
MDETLTQIAYVLSFYSDVVVQFADDAVWSRGVGAR